MADSSTSSTGSRSWAPVPTRGTFRGRGRGRGGVPSTSTSRLFGLISQRQLRYAPYRPRSGVADKPPTSAAYGRTLGFVTNAKLDELEKQREAYRDFTRVLNADSSSSLSEPSSSDAEEHRRALVSRLSDLHRAVVNHLPPGSQHVINGDISIDDLGVWLERAKIDSNFNQSIIKEWIEGLETHIKQGEMKLEFAKLCGRLYTDWLESGDAITVRSDLTGPLPPQEKEELDTKQEGRKEMQEQVARLRSIIFESTHIDTEALETYLEDVFSAKSSKQVLENMRDGMLSFGQYLHDRTITASDIRWTVESLLASDLMLPDKRAALREFTDNPTVLEEVANVINMRLRTVGSWKWPVEGIVVDMRRYLNGKYRAFTDPDILDALFLQWVGIMWGIKFKQDARDIFATEAWKVTMVGEGSAGLNADTVSPGSINYLRKHHREQHFLVGHLPDDVNPRAHYDEPADAMGDDSEKGTVDVKQKLLNIISTECYLNLSLHGSHTIVRTDVDWFGPSLPHESIITILRFFGVPQDWLEFFYTFLRMPIRFPGEPDVQTRVRGTPISYALSGFFGEVILFAMDFAVNQRANGLFLYRIHDDIWFWDSNSQRCAAAWQEMNKYATLVGLKFNEGKTGSVCVRGGETARPDLPVGDIRWGFLKFDVSEARFIIDQQQVDEHIHELGRQLGNTKSLLGWISVYNKYMAFFVRNFSGRPAECFGKRHVTDMMRTLVRIQQEIIPGSVGVIEHLEVELATRYDVRDLPRGYFFFPLSIGGLSLRDPLIDIQVMGEHMTDDSIAFIDNALLSEKEVYEKVKIAWEQKQRQDAVSQGLDPPPAVFIPFEAYCEMASLNLTKVYTTLIQVKPPRAACLTPVIRAAVKSNMLGSENYKSWVFEAYGKEVIRKFGGLDIVDPRMIPIGLVHLYKTSRIKWDQ